MKETKKKRKGWRRRLGAIVLIAVLFLGLQYVKPGGVTQAFIQDTINQFTDLMKNLGTILKSNMIEQGQGYVPGSVAAMVSPLSTPLGISADEFVLFSILFAAITLAALSAGWYLRKFGKKKWLGYCLSFIGFLPLLPIMLAGTLVYWMGKKYWMGGRVHPKKESVETRNHLTVDKGSSPVDDWEQAFKRMEKLQA
ncbi:multidrug effflux MFS transporter [Bacillus sp. X1(2014)]|uniref:multidrug effflux MFS transporter n=1 Tax=Bacillus sp. X1(2014) TaxID=1565991 RepID=UPI0011A6E4D9|nr:multidrug effflux MFS transporter [Bacillus sp. X1(2014)]